MLTRLATPVLLVLALLCVLLPFVTVGCDDRTTYRGVDFIESDLRDFESEDEEAGADEAEDVLGSGAAAVTLAVVFAGLGALAGLVPGLAAAATTYAAAAVAAAALSLCLLSGSLRGGSSVFVDFRYGFWLALTFAAAAAMAGWWRWQRAPRVAMGFAGIFAFVGIALLTLAVLVPQIGVTSGEDSEEESAGPDPPDGFRGYSVPIALIAGTRRTEAWDAAALMTVLFVALILVLLLMRQASRLAAWALTGLGSGWAVVTILDLAYLTISDWYGLGDGAFPAVLGALALAGAGLLAARSTAGGAERLDIVGRGLVLGGSVLAVAGTLLPIQRSDEERHTVALLYGGPSVTRVLAIAPIVLAAAAIAVIWLLPGLRGHALLFGLSVTLLCAFVPLASPLFDGPEVSARAGPGAFVGAAGGLVIGFAALRALWREREWTKSAAKGAPILGAP